MKKIIIKCSKCNKKMKVPYFIGKNIKVTCPYCMYKFDIVIPKKRFPFIDIAADAFNPVASLLERFKSRFFSSKETKREFTALMILISLLIIYLVLR